MSKNYWLHSTTRAAHTKMLRSTAPSRVRRTQFVLDTQQRLPPGGKIELSEEDVRRNLASIRELQAQGIVELRNGDGHMVEMNGDAVEMPEVGVPAGTPTPTEPLEAEEIDAPATPVVEEPVAEAPMNPDFAPVEKAPTPSPAPTYQSYSGSNKKRR